MGIQFDVTGGREVRAAVRLVASRVRASVSPAALERAVRPLLDRAREEAPRDTGNLAAHVFGEVRESRGAVSAEVGVRGVQYANVVHHAGVTRHREADPFLTRALDAEGAGVARRLEDLVRDSF